MTNNNKDSSYTELDQLDLTLIEELEVDARQTSRDLGRKLGVSATTVSNRMRKMVENEIIDFAVVTNHFATGLRLMTLWGIKATSGKSSDVIEYFKGDPNVRNLGRFTGRYDVLMYTLFRDNEELLHWMIERLSHAEDVLVAEPMTVIKVITHSSKYLHADPDVLYRNVYPRLDKYDTKLIKELELEPRDTYESLGKKAGVSRQLAAKRLKKFMDTGVVRVFSLIDPLKLGYSVCAYIFIKVLLNRIMPVTIILADHPKVKYVSIITGASNIMIYAAFRDVDEMSCFLTDELSIIPGIIGHETMIQVGRVNGFYPFMNWCID